MDTLLTYAWQHGAWALTLLGAVICSIVGFGVAFIITAIRREREEHKLYVIRVRNSRRRYQELCAKEDAESRRRIEATRAEYLAMIEAHKSRAARFAAVK